MEQSGSMITCTKPVAPYPICSLFHPDELCMRQKLPYCGVHPNTDAAIGNARCWPEKTPRFMMDMHLGICACTMQQNNIIGAPQGCIPNVHKHPKVHRHAFPPSMQRARQPALPMQYGPM